MFAAHLFSLQRRDDLCHLIQREEICSTSLLSAEMRWSLDVQRSSLAKMFFLCAQRWDHPWLFYFRNSRGDLYFISSLWLPERWDKVHLCGCQRDEIKYISVSNRDKKFILFFYFILFLWNIYFILFYFILFFCTCSTEISTILFYFILFYFILFYFFVLAAQR